MKSPAQLQRVYILISLTFLRKVNLTWIFLKTSSTPGSLHFNFIDVFSSKVNLTWMFLRLYSWFYEMSWRFDYFLRCSLCLPDILPPSVQNSSAKTYSFLPLLRLCNTLFSNFYPGSTLFIIQLLLIFSTFQGLDLSSHCPLIPSFSWLLFPPIISSLLSIIFSLQIPYSQFKKSHSVN